MRSRAAQKPVDRQLETIIVELGDRSYPIVIGRELLDEVGSRLASLGAARRTVIVSNPTVGALYLDRVVTSLREAGFETTSIMIPDGEEHKNLRWLTFVYDRLVAAHLERSSPILALGGGVVGDLSGFAAATFLRGVPFVQLPTTLLAQVDSSVGGKTAINHPAGKNLIGAFYQPCLVLADLDVLHTLPQKEFVAGLAEVIKYAVILDAKLFALIEQELDRLLALDEELLRAIVRRCCALKAMVVHRDEREAGYRSILNFGHTIGHAIESLTAYQRYLHGEAVAVGMAFAARISSARGYCTPETMERLVGLLKRSGLPVELPRDVTWARLESAMESDKKASGGTVKFVCVEDVGRTRFEDLTAHEIAELAAH